MAVFMQPIYTQTVGAGGAASITFNNIPQGFTDLKIVVSARSGFATGDAMWLQLGVNNALDSTQSYSNIRNYANAGNVANSDRWMNATYTLYFAALPGASSTANTFINGEIYIPNYTSGHFKQIIYDGSCENNSATVSWQEEFYAALYRNKAAITNFRLGTFNGGGFVENTTVTVYGISNVYDTRVPTAPTLGTITDQAGFFSVGFTPAANDGADSYYAYSPASPESPVYGIGSPIVIPVEAQYSYNASIWVAAVNSLGVTQSTTTSAGNVTSNNYASIATIAVSSSTSTITFTNIPQNYSHLQLRCFGRSATSTYSQLDMNLNSDVTNAYTYHTVYGDGANAGSGNSSPRSNIPQIGDLIGTANTPGVSVVDILDYSKTNKNKTVRWLYGHDLNGSGLVGMGSSAYMNLAPVSSITLSGRSQNIGQYSHFALYGIA
jgi:hypothetical protein